MLTLYYDLYVNSCFLLTLQTIVGYKTLFKYGYNNMYSLVISIYICFCVLYNYFYFNFLFVISQLESLHSAVLCCKKYNTNPSVRIIGTLTILFLH